MNLIKIFFIIMLFQAYSFGAFQKLKEGYLDSKISKENKLDQEVTDNSHLVNLASNPWYFTLSGGQTSNDLETSLVFQGRGLVTQNYSVGLSKSTFNFGTFSFSHTDIDNDFTDFTINPNNFEHLYEKRNTFLYSYDFLDKSSSWNYENFQEKNKKEKLKNFINQNQDDTSFMQAYLKAKFDLFNLKLQKEFTEKSRKRFKRTSQMFKDGTVRKVDFLQAQLKYQTDQRKVIEAQSLFDSSLLKVEAILNAKIPMKALASIKWNFISLDKYSQLLENNEMKDVELIKASLKELETNNRAYLDKTGHKLVLEFKYESNTLAQDREDLLDDSLNDAGGENRQISLTYKIGFGDSYINSRNASMSSQIKRLEMIKNIKTDEIMTIFQDLNKNLKITQDLIYSLETEEKLAQDTFESMNKLYNRGQASYADVISTQESLLAVQSQKVKYLYQYENALAQYCSLNGSIRTYMNGYRD